MDGGDPNATATKSAPVEDGTTPSSDPSTEPSGKPSLFQRAKVTFMPPNPDADNTNSDEGNENSSEKLPPIPFTQLFSYTESYEVFLLLFACVAAAIHGTILPLFTIVFGSVLDVLGGDVPTDEVVSKISGIAKWFLILGGIAFVSAFIQVRFSLVSAQRVSRRLRSLYFTSLMRQDFTWYDNTATGELTARVTADVNLIEAGIGDKVSSATQFISMFLTGVIIAFVHNWKLTFIIFAAAPFLTIGGIAFAKLAASTTGSAQDAYASASAVASEALSLIRTVAAYNGQDSEAKRYERNLDVAYRATVRKAAFTGLSLGFTYFVIFCTFAVAFVFGASETRNNRDLDPGDVVVTFFSVFIATLSIGQAAPAFNAITVARGAAPRVYEIIRRQSEIDPLDEDAGEIPDSLSGAVSFDSVEFNYANRVIDTSDPEQRPNVLSNFNMSIRAGSSHALVGFSGCGKSTTVRLIERFYDVQKGAVRLDGVDIRSINVRWLRSQIGYVGQMPTLFMLSIRENIALGAPMEISVDETTGKKALKRREVTDEEIVTVAKLANCHDFIEKLPEKYDTMLGERGALLSGGQKQRICIARALIRNPKILLLDESTSALDAQSERQVQDALEKAAHGRTTVIIAHRLSTVKNCDVISVLDKGVVVEMGSHEELLAKGGAYKTLVENQNVETEKVDEAVKAGGLLTESEARASMSKSKDKSLTKVDGKEEEEEDDGPPVDKGVFKRALTYNLGEVPFILVGLIGAIFAGATFPAMAIPFSHVINDLFVEDNVGLIRRWAFVFIGMGGAAFVAYFFQFTMLGVSGGRLTRKLRAASFRATLRQDMGFFDEKKNAIGQLTTRLTTEATLVQGLTGDTLGMAVQVTSTILTGFIVSFISCWRIALVLLSIFPLMAVSEGMQMKLMTGFDADSEKRFAQSGAVAAEAVDNYDTVSSIGAEDYFIGKYLKELEIPLINGRKRAFFIGLTFGIAEFIQQALWAIAFWVGAVFVRSGGCSFVDLMKGISGLLFAGSAMGQAAMFMPDIGKSNVAATSIFRLLDRTPAIDVEDEGGHKTDTANGDIKAKGLKFEYPTRPDVRVLRGLSLEAGRGQTVALVGESGCGKSTVVALLQRFYDVREGSIALDERDMREYNVKNLRGHIGTVSQEPDLFNRSVRDNIAYGLNHEEGTVVTDEMIISAAKEANAHEFISELADGYDFVVGARGSRLSGGQRQRVAIARAVVGKPRVLTLDEASSALDSVSERMVQEALRAAAEGRTTVVVAHRLSTIKDADIIAVVKGGVVVEKGSHDELLARNGDYAKLVRNQLSEVG